MEVIKRDFLIKRAQLKSCFSRITYKRRWFELFREFLQYSEGTIESGSGQIKGKIFLKDVIVVEEAESIIFENYKHPFQIIYKENNQLIVLYVFAPEYKRIEWISALRIECQKQNAIFSKKYHRGAWNSRSEIYTCCNSKKKFSEGCLVATILPPLDNMQNDKDVIMTVNLKIEFSPMGKKRVLQSDDSEGKYCNQLEFIKMQDCNFIRESSCLASNKIRNQQSKKIESYSDLTSYKWYFPDVNRYRSELILIEDGREGVFLVRKSQMGSFAISLFTKKEEPSGVVLHYLITKMENGLLCLINNHEFKFISELINYHMHNAGGLGARLRCTPNDDPDSEKYIPLPPGVHNIEWTDLRFFEELGKGEFGTVYRGTFKDTVVAIKTMHTGAMLEEDFVDEAKTMMMFQHDNLIQLYGICTDYKPLIIVTEYMKNGSLLSYILKNQSYLKKNINLLKCMCHDVCKGMLYLESKGIIHRDLAARNCLVNELGLVKVGDFGLARKVLDNEYSCSSNAVIPTRWCAPEVLLNYKYSCKSDVWAFGIMMWEVFSLGENPYKDIKSHEIAYKINFENYRMIIPDLCDSSFSQIILNCWQKEPEDRPTFEKLHEIFNLIE